MVTLIGGDLYQWDTCRRILIEPDNGYDIHEVHFTTRKMDHAYVVKTYIRDGAVYCSIPNILLQQYYPIFCYEVRENDGGEESVSMTKLRINKRNRPMDYVYSESDQYTYAELDSRVTELEADVNDLDDKIDVVSNTMVKSVNDTPPDETGNITIEGGTGDSNNVASF